MILRRDLIEPSAIHCATRRPHKSAELCAAASF
jgi:hypothetical protein